MSVSSGAPAQILAFKTTRPPGDKKSIQSPMDLSRVPSFFSLTRSLRCGGAARARRVATVLPTVCGREVKGVFQSGA